MNRKILIAITALMILICACVVVILCANGEQSTTNPTVSTTPSAIGPTNNVEPTVDNTTAKMEPTIAVDDVIKFSFNENEYHLGMKLSDILTDSNWTIKNYELYKELGELYLYPGESRPIVLLYKQDSEIHINIYNPKDTQIPMQGGIISQVEITPASFSTNINVTFFGCVDLTAPFNDFLATLGSDDYPGEHDPSKGHDSYMWRMKNNDVIIRINVNNTTSMVESISIKMYSPKK